MTSDDTPISSHRARPDVRERALLLGTETLSDHDLLALLLGTGSNGESAARIAARLIEGEGGLVNLARTGAHALSARRGLGPAKATRIVAALELGRRVAVARASEARRSFRSFADVVAWAGPRLAPLEHEEVWLLCLDARNGLIAAHCVARGGAHGCALVPGDILRPALRDGASGIILLHNHPSGDATPSAEDVQMTRSLAGACRTVSVALLDHVVVARGGSTSLADLGTLDGIGPR